MVIEQMMCVRITCQKEMAGLVMRLLSKMCKQFNLLPCISVNDVHDEERPRYAVISAYMLYLDEDVDKFWARLTYHVLHIWPGITSAEVILSGMKEQERSLKEREACALAEIIKQQAPWLDKVSVIPASLLYDDFPPDSTEYICYIESQDLKAEVTSFGAWTRLLERIAPDNDWKKTSAPASS